MKRILVPVDFSNTSVNALTYAIHFFAGIEAEITVLHTYDLSSSAFHMKSMDGILEDTAQEEMTAVLNKVQALEPKAVLKPKILKGDAVSTITSLGNSGTYDFIVMGTKGASGLKEVFIGSVAGGVISNTSAPVLVVPAGYQYRPVEEIVFAVSDVPFSDPAVVDPLRQLVGIHGTKVNVLHVAEEQKPDLQEVLSPIADLNPTATIAFGAGNVNRHLKDYLATDGDRILCLVRSKKGFFNRLVNESVTMKQTFQSPVPLLILHE